MAPQGKSNRTPLLVLMSSKRSLEQESFSFLAILETVAAVFLFWQLADWLGTAVIVVTSLFVAPLLLMRSPESVSLAVKWSEEYWDRSFEDVWLNPGLAIRSMQFWVSLIVASIVVGIASYLFTRMSIKWSPQGPKAYIGALIGFLSMQAGLAITAAGAAKQMLAIARVAAVRMAGILFTLVSVITYAGANLGGSPSLEFSLFAAALAGAVAIMATATVFDAGAAAIRSGETRAIGIARDAVRRNPFSLAACLFGALVGGWMRIAAIRFLATASHPIRGWHCIPANWRRTVLVTDVRVPPELVPGYSRGDAFNVAYVIQRLRQATQKKRYFYIAVFLILFVPAWLYRMYIKSTSWFYLPLIYIARPVKVAQYPGYLCDLVLRDANEWWRRAFAYSSLFAFAAVSVWPQAVILLRANAPAVLSPIEYLFHLDFTSVKPWQWCMVSGAIITLALPILAKRLRILLDHQSSYSELVASASRVAYGIEFARRIRNVFAFLFFCIVLAHLLLAVTSLEDYLPARALEMLASLYGSAMPERAR